MRIALAIGFLLVLILRAYSQERLLVQEQPLEEVIVLLERFYGIKFSYVDEAVQGKVVSFEATDDQPVATFLSELEKVTGIRFEMVDDHYVIIRPFYGDDSITICGTVVGEDGKPVSELVVRSDQEGAGAITDQEGQFELTVPYRSVLTFRHIGFVVKKGTAGEYLGSDCAVIAMKPAFSILDELVVEDYLTAGIVKRGKDIEIHPQELKILPGMIEPDILQSIQQTPGVNSPYETAVGIHVRGGSPDQNLVLWNGIKTYNQGHFFGMLSAFNPYITEKVKFIKNGTSAAYGGRVSSVIDIKTSEEVSKAFSGGAGFNMIYGDGFLNAPLIKDKLSVFISGRRSYTDLLETFTYRQFSKRVFQNTKIDAIQADPVNSQNQFYFNDFNTGIVFQPTEHNKILLSSLYNKNDLDFSSINAGDSLAFKDRLRTENEGYNLKWIHERRKFSIHADASYSKYLLRYEFLNVRSDSVELSSKKNLIRDLGFRLQGNYRLTDRQDLLVGYELSDNNTRYAFEDFTPLYHLVLDQDNRTVRTHSAFTEYQLQTEKTKITAGIRLNRYSGLDTFYVEPRVYFQQRLAKPLFFNASAEYRSQVISQIKESVVSDLSLENQVWKLASKERFPVIDSYQFTSGLVFNKNRWFLDAEAYYKQIDGVTTLTFGFLNPVDNEYRRGSSTIRGIDFFVKKQLDAYSTWASYSYIQTENRFFGLNNGQPFPGNWNIRHYLQWSHFYIWNDLQFSLGWTWHTGKSYTEVSEVVTSGGPVVVQYDGINAGNLPVYHRLDFSAVYDFGLAGNDRVRYRIGVSVLNLYDRKNLLNREFRTTPSLENELIDTRIYSLGITPNLVFRCFW